MQSLRREGDGLDGQAKALTMASVKLTDMREGDLYREVLSGYTVRVRDFIRAAGTGDRLRVIVNYHNPISGLFVECELEANDLEPLPDQQ